MDVHDSDWRSLYPFRSRFLRLDGSRYHYLDEGSGSPLLMVHGNPTWSFYWRNLVTAFRNEYRVVVPDHLGCGLSDKPQKYAYNLSSHVANLVALIGQLDLRNITLMAHDWGGAIGLGAALAEPERFARIVLFNTGAFPPPFVPLRIRCCRTPVFGTWAIRRMNLFAKAALTMAVAQPDAISPPVAAGLLAPYDNWENRIGIDRFVRDIPLTRLHPTWRTLSQIESGLELIADRPVQLIWGMQDWCFRPECLARFQAVFPEAEVHKFEDAGHYVVEEASDHIIPLINRFLRKTRQRG
jgi:pimeloyl-ACP methyl ester carboxylesterase